MFGRSLHFGVFLAYLFFMLILMPILYDLFPIDRLLDFVLLGMMVTGAWSLFPSTKARIGFGLLITAMLTLHLSLIYSYNKNLHILWITVHILFAILILWETIKRVLKAKIIDKNIVFAGMCTYLMVGILLALIYHLIDLSDPNAFSGPYTEGTIDSKVGGHILTFIYFSFVTLTTLGYGDIVPLSAVARAISMGEAIIGQLFIAVILGHLVSHRVQIEIPEKK